MIVGWCYLGTTERVSELRVSRYRVSPVCISSYIHMKVTGRPEGKKHHHTVAINSLYVKLGY